MGRTGLLRVFLAACGTLALLAPSPSLAGGAAAPGGLASDPQHGLTWVADGAFIIRAGLSASLELPRAKALAIVAAMNRGEAPNFGFRDWRLPTPAELALLKRAYRAGTLDLVASPAVTAVLQRSTAGPAERVVAWPVRGSSILPGFTQVVLLGTNSVRLKNQASVASGNVVANAASPGPTLQSGYELSLDPQAVIAAGGLTAGDSVRIKNNAIVGGDLAYNDLSNQGTVSGTLTTPLALPVFPLLPAFATAVPGSTAVTVAAGGSRVLSAGAYAAVTVGAGGTLSLTGGIYQLASLSLGVGARMLLAGPADVRIAGRLTASHDAVIGPDPATTASPSDLVFYVAGINGSNGALGSTPEAVDLGQGAIVGASVYAPNGTVHLGHGGDFTGAFLGRDVLVENQARVALASYFFNRPPVPANDAATVDEGGTVTALDGGALSVLANDSDPNFGDTLTVTTTPLVGPVHGSLVLAANGTFQYTHDGSETTADQFVYQVCDNGSPALCASAVVAITVRPVNDPPVAVPDSASVAQGGTATVLDSSATSVLANDTDAEGGLLTASLVSGPSHGTLTLNPDGTFSYTHDASATISDQFDYQACDDGVPVLCATATVSIVVRPPILVTILVFGLGSGTVSSSPAGIDCGSTCSATFSGGQPITLTAVASGTSVFTGFGGDPDCADGVLVPDADKTCTARFDASAVPAILTVVTAGAGSGRVVSDVAGIDCPGLCSAGYPVPTRVTLTAEPNSGSVFTGWSGDAACTLVGEVALFADTTCVATFELLPPPPPSYRLTVVFLGAGTGTVTSNPAGLLCTGDCASTFPQGAAVTLFARPDGESLPTWGGDCSGNAIATSLTMDGDKTCTVEFP